MGGIVLEFEGFWALSGWFRFAERGGRHWNANAWATRDWKSQESSKTVERRVRQTPPPSSVVLGATIRKSSFRPLFPSPPRTLFDEKASAPVSLSPSSQILSSEK